jgi:CHRD domain
MNTFVRCLSLSVTLVTLMISVTGSAQDSTPPQTDLSGFKEVVGPDLGIGAIFSTGNGQLTLKINKQSREIAYQLTYQFPDAAATPIVGTQFVNQAHLHFGQKHTTGAINVWLCQSADSPAPAAVALSTPTCPSPSGTVAGSITPAKVLALPAQGFPGGEAGFDALLAAIRNDAIYGNVHTDRSPAGEIRGQVGDLPPQ